MAKKKEESAEDEETNRSIGSQLKTKMSTHERNLKVKQEMIDNGERDEPKEPTARTQRERNLNIKKLKADKDKQVEDKKVIKK